MSDADKLLKDAGYEKEDNENFIRYTKGNYIIVFDKMMEQIIFSASRTVYKIISMQELKAINKKCEELRMGGITIGSYY